MRSLPRFLTGAGVTFAATAAAVAWPANANAWPPPTVTVRGGGCTGQTGTDTVPRDHIEWTVHNHETSYPRSPAAIVDVHVTPNFPSTWETPTTLPNTGTAAAKAHTIVPADYSGTVVFTVTIRYAGPDGDHGPLFGEAVATVRACPPPVSTPPQSQVTTSTSTTVPTSTTTTTTVPSTTTTVAVRQAVAEAPAPEPVRAAPRVTG